MRMIFWPLGDRDSACQGKRSLRAQSQLDGHEGHNDVIDAKPPARLASYDKKVALVLQGGGALGSYQAGVYEALASSEYVPDWVAGISIGAINAAIIAGNAPENRVSQLRSFWEEVTSHNSIGPSGLGGPLAEGQRRLSSLVALMFGQPGFFAPRPMLAVTTTRACSGARSSDWSTSIASTPKQCASASAR